ISRAVAISISCETCSDFSSERCIGWFSPQGRLDLVRWACTGGSGRRSYGQRVGGVGWKSPGQAEESRRGSRVAPDPARLVPDGADGTAARIIGRPWLYPESEVRSEERRGR